MSQPRLSSKIALMADFVDSIPIATEHGRSACGNCLQSVYGPVCQDSLGEPCNEPALCGQPEQVARLMHALDTALGGTAAQPGRRWVRALTVEPGEVELTLAFGPRCGGAELAAAAFEALRGLLPDTDIYVGYARR